MGSGVTRRVEQAVKALESGQVKKALWLTDTVKTEKHHKIVAGAARKCLSDRTQCSVFLKDAASELQDTITPPMDTTELDGVEEMLKKEEQHTDQANVTTEPQKTDEELYAECEECHVSDAVVKFHEIAEECKDTAVIETIESTLENEDTMPEEWLKKMVEVTEKPSCGQESYQVVLGELTDYLQGRDSPILKQLDEEKD